MKIIDAVREALKDGPMNADDLRAAVEHLAQRPISRTTIIGNCYADTKKRGTILITGGSKNRIYQLNPTPGRAAKAAAAPVRTLREVAAKHCAPDRQQLAHNHVRDTLTNLERALEAEYEITESLRVALAIHTQAVALAVAS